MSIPMIDIVFLAVPFKDILSYENDEVVNHRIIKCRDESETN